MKDPKNILVVRTDRIGDVVLTLPVSAVLKKYFPNAKITFLIKDYTKPILKNNPFINEVITLAEKNGKTLIRNNVLQLKNKFDFCIVASPSFLIALILFLSKIKMRIGTGYRWYSFLFNKKAYDHRKYAEHHELEFNIRLLKQLGIEENINPLNVSFGLSESKSAKSFIESEFERLGINRSDRIIIIHPGSGGSSIDLPIEKMKELIIKMDELENIAIFITGNKKEKELCQSLVVSKKTINTAGSYRLDQLIALINKSVLFIANSTGPIHIAAALGKYVIGFYPKILSCSEKRWGPYTIKKKIFLPVIGCNNCSREQCEKLNCMDSINIDDVFSSVKNVLIGNGLEK